MGLFFQDCSCRWLDASNGSTQSSCWFVVVPVVVAMELQFRTSDFEFHGDHRFITAVVLDFHDQKQLCSLHLDLSLVLIGVITFSRILLWNAQCYCTT